MSKKRPQIPWGHIVFALLGWATYPIAINYIPQIPLLITAGTLTLFVAPRFFRGPQIKLERKLFERLLQGSVEPSRWVRKNLTEQETTVMELHEHPINLFKWWLGGVLWIAGLGALLYWRQEWFTTIAWLAWSIVILLAAGVVALLIRIALWRRDIIAITRVRLFIREGLITNSVSMIPLSKITDLMQTEVWHARLLAWAGWIESPYGILRNETAGENPKLRKKVYLPGVNEVVKVIQYNSSSSGDAD